MQTEEILSAYEITARIHALVESRVEEHKSRIELLEALRPYLVEVQALDSCRSTESFRLDHTWGS
jgi:hypothetical protein